MLASRGQENLIHARPAAGKALQPKTPSHFQTPRTTNRAPLGAKTTNAKAQTVQKEQKNAKFQVFKTPAPSQQNIRPERTIKRPSTTRASGQSKITKSELKVEPARITDNDVQEEEPDFGYAPPPIVELPDPPMEFGYDETFPQLRPENICRGYGEIYLSSPKDENGFSIRLKKEEEEYHQYIEQQAQEHTRKAQELLSQPYVISDDEFEMPKRKVSESKPDTLKARSAASALSSIRLPSCASKHTASSRLKANKPVPSKSTIAITSRHDKLTSTRPLSVSNNTIGFPKAKRPLSIIPREAPTTNHRSNYLDDLVDDLSDFEFFPASLDEGDDVFQLPMPE